MGSGGGPQRREGRVRLWLLLCHRGEERRKASASVESRRRRGATLTPEPQGLKLEFQHEGVVSTPQESPFSRPKKPLHFKCPVCPLPF